jgi:hypothetical protein
LRAVVGDHHDIPVIQIRGTVRHLHRAWRRRRMSRIGDTQTDWQQLDFVAHSGGQRCARWRER